MYSGELQYKEVERKINELEGTAFEEYLVYAKKAREQGYEYIARLFEEAHRLYSNDI